MDTSWNSSQWLDVVHEPVESETKVNVRMDAKQTAVCVISESSDDDLEDNSIPQLDGPVDVKSGESAFTNR